MAKAICPGSFDPVTNGHLDIVERAARIFDQVIVVTFKNAGKRQPLFNTEERLAMLREVTSHIPNVSVDCFDGLLTTYARHHGCTAIVKGLRAIQDFEYEFQMGLMNKKLAPDIETMFLMTSGRFSYLSSSLVKELASYGAPLHGLVPDAVAQRLRERFAIVPGR